MATETWYLLEDGAVADPSDVAPGDKGMLKHKDGRAVAYSPYGPRSRSVDPDAERTKSQPESKAKPKSKDMKADESKSGYTTRETKAQ